MARLVSETCTVFHKVAVHDFLGHARTSHTCDKGVVRGIMCDTDTGCSIVIPRENHLV